MVNFGSAISGAWGFAKDGKRLATLSLVYVILAALVLSPLLLVYRNFGALTTLNPTTILGAFALFGVAAIVAVLVVLFMTALFIHNYSSKKTISASAAFAKSVYLKFLAVIIIYGIIHVLVSLVLFIGIILSLIVSIMLFFLQVEAVIGRSSVTKSFSNAYSMFSRRKKDTFLTFLLSVVIELLIVGVFALPMLALVFSSAAAGLSSGQFTATIMARLPLFAVAGIILAVGAALATLFNVGLQTDVYRQMKGRTGQDADEKKEKRSGGKTRKRR